MGSEMCIRDRDPPVGCSEEPRVRRPDIGGETTDGQSPIAPICGGDAIGVGRNAYAGRQTDGAHARPCQITRCQARREGHGMRGRRSAGGGVRLDAELCPHPVQQPESGVEIRRLVHAAIVLVAAM